MALMGVSLIKALIRDGMRQRRGLMPDAETVGVKTADADRAD